ncbi:ABC transporter substrate-binding protein [Arthrobacter sp. NPDC080031]|uniref:ABC transporter substrate-binding protein n=1 Tax=Arthrobacter sp. NPDC080031 TaxID=3155918 RepID=UPI00344B7243
MTNRQHRRLKGALAASVAGLLALSLASCSSDAAATPSSGPTGDPVHGGSFTYLSFNESAGLDPIKMHFGNQSGDTDQGEAIFDTLMYQDTSGRPVMKTAESLTSDDGVHWDLTIKKGIAFTDGTPYDAAAVKFNWERMADPANGAPNAAGMANVAGLAIKSDLVLSITLSKQYRSFPQTVARYLSMIGSPTAIKALGKDFAIKPVGAGPFMVQSWTRDSELRLVRNPKYWQEGMPYLDSMNIRQVSDEEQRLNTFTAGQADAAMAGPSTPSAKRAADQGAQVFTKPYGGGINMIFNTRVAPFNDAEARKGVAMALDLGQLNEVISQGTSPAPTTMFVDGTPFYEPDVKFLSAQQNKAQAQQLFNDYAARTGGPVKFKLTSTTVLQQAFELIQAQLSSYKNVEVTFQAIQNTALAPALVSHDFQAVSYAAYGDDFEPTLYNQYYSTGKQNWSGINDPVLDKALDQGRNTADPAQRKAAYKTAQERLVALVPDVFVERYEFNYMFSPKVGGFQAPSSGVQWEKVWLAKNQ